MTADDLTVGIGDPESPTIVHDVESPVAIGIHFDCPANSRKEFLQEWARKLQQETVLSRAIAKSPNYVLLAISLEPCNGRATYRTVDDIPLTDAPCPCGDPSHWLIKYSNT